MFSAFRQQKSARNTLIDAKMAGTETSVCRMMLMLIRQTGSGITFWPDASSQCGTP